MAFKFQSVLFVVLTVSSLLCLNNNNVVEGQASTAAGECSEQIQKVMPCLTYATGKAAVPTPACCTSVKDIKESEPKCLCIIMQQTHNGSAQIKNLGIQEAKLLQLPTACKLQNASVSFCPKLLGLDPNSPDAAIFTNITSTTPTETTGTAAPDTTDSSKNIGTNHKPLYFPSFIAIALAIFISTLCV